MPCGGCKTLPPPTHTPYFTIVHIRFTFPLGSLDPFLYLWNWVLLMYMLEGVSCVANFITAYKESQWNRDSRFICYVFFVNINGNLLYFYCAIWRDSMKPIHRYVICGVLKGNSYRFFCLIFMSLYSRTTMSWTILGYGYFEPLRVNHGARSGIKSG